MQRLLNNALDLGCSTLCLVFKCAFSRVLSSNVCLSLSSLTGTLRSCCQSVRRSPEQIYGCCFWWDLQGEDGEQLICRCPSRLQHSTVFEGFPLTSIKSVILSSVMKSNLWVLVCLQLISTNVFSQFEPLILMKQKSCFWLFTINLKKKKSLKNWCEKFEMYFCLLFINHHH